MIMLVYMAKEKDIADVFVPSVLSWAHQKEDYTK